LKGSIKVKTKTFGLILLLGYVSFIPPGPFPIYVVGGLKLDVLFGLLLVLFLVCFCAKEFFNWSRMFLFAGGFYVAAILLSALLSENIQQSLQYAIITMGYITVLYLVPMVFVHKADFLRKWMFGVAVLVGLLIIVLYTVFGFAHSHRFALAMADVSSAGAGSKEGVTAVDSNMTAAGLMLSLIVYFPCLFKKKKYIFLELVGLVCVVGGVVITLSRSATLGGIVAVSMAASVVLFRSFMSRGFKVKKNLLIGFSSALFMVFILGVAVHSFIPDVIEMVIGRVSRAGHDTERLYVLKNAWSVFSASSKSTLIGNGFMTTNPHNEFMRALSTMGILGALSATLFVASILFQSFSMTLMDDRRLFSAVAIAVFVLVITLFYGYTKLLWVAWMFLLFLSRESTLIQRGFLLSK